MAHDNGMGLGLGLEVQDREHKRSASNVLPFINISPLEHISTEECKQLRDSILTFKKSVDALATTLRNEVYGGLNGVFKQAISGLNTGFNAGVNSLSTKLPKEIQERLHSVLGSFELIEINNALQKSCDAFDSREINAEIFRKQLVDIQKQSQITLHGLTTWHIPPRIYTDVFEKFTKAITNCPQNPTADDIQTVRNITCEVKQDLHGFLQGTLANLLSNVGVAISKASQNITDSIEKTADRTINSDLPRTLKKTVFYVGLGFIATYAAYRSLFNELPREAHLKNIGIAAGSILTMFGIDRIIDYIYPPSVVHAD